MKRIAPITILLLLILQTGNIYAQKLSKKQVERENNKVAIYTSEEKDNLQRFYHEEVQKMKLTKDEEEAYYQTLLSYTYDMARLDDKDKDYTFDEMRLKLDVLVNKLNAEMKSMLSSEQYVIHLETFGKIISSVYQKRNWDKN